jgi:hypothetical protein
MYSDGRLFRLPDGDLGETGTHSRHVSVEADHDYCSLVEERWRDFIHWISAASP